MIAGLLDAVDRFVGVDVAELPDAALCIELRELSRTIDRLEHRRAVLIAAVHGRQIPDGVGAVSTPAWVQHETGLPIRDARQALASGVAMETLPLTSKAWAQGEISAGAAHTIVRGVPEGHEDAYGEIEETLVGFAADHDLRDLQTAISYARRCADALDDREPSDLNGATHAKVGDRWMLAADLDDLGGSTVDRALSAATDKSTSEDSRSAKKRRADALVRIARFFLDHENLPVEGGEKPHISFGIDYETIVAGLPSHAELGLSLSPADIGVLLCDAQIERIITGTHRVPLDIGRLAHDPPKPMRRAVAARDCRCRFPRCHRKASGCDIHHVKMWIKGGETNIWNLVLLCSYHHHLIHRRGWTATFDGVTFEVYKPDGTYIGATHNADAARAGP